MANDESSMSSGSRIQQFGLYRSIDARTEEFLRLSRKRQIRQGCACAAASTAITVTVVIVILLIYEYAIAVEWSSVQRKTTNDATNYTNDIPFADRLDRSYFGFDQDYFERMPLLVNALQESNYVDPLTETSKPIHRKLYNKSITTRKPILKTDTHSKIRRTSPRPFIFENRSPTPIPFSKTYGSRSWVDSYRNAQRLQNIRQVIKYLEKTINAKMGDIYTKPSSAHTSISFPGVYVEPIEDKLRSQNNPRQTLDMQEQSSDQVESYQSNHQSDPLFKFKPISPGDVNLLADGLWRFAPIPGFSYTDSKVPAIPMFKKNLSHTKKCPDGKCENDDIASKVIDLLQSSTNRSTEWPSTKPKSFSVMLNLFPFKPSTSSEFKSQDIKNEPPIEKIYLTTSKPVRFQFRRKSILPERRVYNRKKKPKLLIHKKNEFEERLRARNSEKTTQAPDDVETTKKIVHVNVYSPEDKKDKTDMKKETDFVTEQTTTTNASSVTPLPDFSFKLSSGQVEDFHDGSSGVIPVYDRAELPFPVVPQVTTMIPFFDTNTASSEVTNNSWPTNPPEIIKFGAEDAKVPVQYLTFVDTTTEFPVTEFNRKTSSTNLEYVEDEYETLIARLKNDIISTTTTEMAMETTTFDIEGTTSKTYVPQTNGHYRSLSTRYSAHTTERNRKKRIEMSVTGFRTYVPMYVEIKRNKTKTKEGD